MSAETVSTDGRRLAVHRLGYSYAHLDRYGRLSDARTCTLTSAGVSPDFMDDGKLKQDGREYFIYFTAKLNPANIDARALLYKKLWIEKELVHVGNSSFATLSVLKCPDRLKVLAEAKFISVHVDRETRQKRELPKWFRDKYGHLKHKTVIFESPTVPREWCHEVKVQPSHTDFNKHANYAVYITYCQDAVYKYEKAHSNLVWLQNHSLREVDFSYLADALQGDILTLHVVKQFPPEGETFYINVEKQGVVHVKARLRYCLHSGSQWAKL